MTEALRVSGVEKTLGRSFGKRGGHPALRGVDLSVRTGEVYGLLGPNGAGKTTLMKTIAGLLRLETGQISVFGRPLDTGSRRALGTLIDGPGLWPRLNAAEHVRVHTRLRGVPEQWGHEALEAVAMAELADRRVSAYSLGMRWRLGIALALVSRPSLLVLDEPTNGLDPLGMRDMRGLLRRLAEQGTTVFVSSHQLDQIARICDRVGVLVDGATRYEGTLEGLAAGGDLEEGFLDLVSEGAV